MNSNLLEIIGVSREFKLGDTVLKAVDDVTLTIKEQEILGVVGESGSGKSTLARMVMALDKPTEGNILFENWDMVKMRPKALQPLRANFQMVFQDPYGSLNPRHKIERIVSEPLFLSSEKLSDKERKKKVADLLVDVGLSIEDMDKYPHEFSGGQRQRIAIARALITKPKLLVADEATSALDLTVQAQILKLILKMRSKYGISVLFITHNIGVVDAICDTVAVMQSGKIVESGPVSEVLRSPKKKYTQRLLSAELTLDNLGRKGRKAS